MEPSWLGRLAQDYRDTVAAIEARRREALAQGMKIDEAGATTPENDEQEPSSRIAHQEQIPSHLPDEKLQQVQQQVEDYQRTVTSRPSHLTPQESPAHQSLLTSAENMEVLLRLWRDAYEQHDVAKAETVKSLLNWGMLSRK